MKKILVIQGGGRPAGSTARLVDAFSRGAREAGHQVEVISLAKHPVNGCLVQCLPVWEALRPEGRIQRSDSQDPGGGLPGVCLSPVFLDHLQQAEGLY